MNRLRSPRVQVLLLAALLCGTMLRTTFTDRIFQNGDNLGYMILGTSLSHGTGFSDISRPEHPQMLWWPPGWPAAIGLFHLLAGPNWLALKMLVFILFFAATAWWGLILLARNSGSVAALCVTAALALSGTVHLVSSYLYSETWFLIVLIGFFGLWQHWEHRLSTLKIVVLGLLAVYTGSVRIVGMVLPAVLSFELLLSNRKQRRYLPYAWIIPLTMLVMYSAVISLVPALKVGSFLAFFAHASRPPSPTAGPALVSIARLGHSVSGYFFSLIPHSLVPTTYQWHKMDRAKLVWTGLVTLVTGWGILKLFVRYRLESLFTLGVGAILASYGALYTRLLIPVLPFLFLFLFAGIEDMTNRLRIDRRIRGALLAVIWIWVLTDNGLASCVHPRRNMQPEFGDSSCQACIEWTIKNVPRDKTMLSQICWYLYLTRGGNNVNFDQERMSNVEQTLAFLDSCKIDYIMISPFRMRRHYIFMDTMRKTLRAYPERFSRSFGAPTDASYVVQYHRSANQ